MSIKVSHKEARKLLRQYFEKSEAEDRYIDWALTLALDRELEGNFFSGLEEAKKFYGMLESTNKGRHELALNSPSLKHVKCNGVSGQMVIRDILDRVDSDIDRVGMVTYAMFDSSSYFDGFTTVVRELAAKNYVTIYSSSGGPWGVAPYGSKGDILGTNPLSYGIPTEGDPIVFDAATAKRAYGVWTKSKREGQPLPEDSFMDKDGNITTDPGVATHVMPFGDYKGYAINLMLEVMTTSMVGGQAGRLQSEDQRKDLGAFMMVIDPSKMVDIGEFKKQNTRLVTDIEATEPLKGFNEVRVPGIRAAKARRIALADDEIQVEEATWGKIQELAGK